jgi:NodT family efflux transporter outer membrane factor (OMF) lipoprotein
MLREAEGVKSKPSGGAAEVAKWWTVFGDEKLTSLVERAAGANLDVAAAEARVRQARASVDSAAAGLSPTVDVNGNATRSRSKGGGTGNTFRAGFDAAWEIDVFGGIRRGVESANAQEQAAVEDWRDVRVTVVAEVANTYIFLRGYQRQLAIARENLTTQQETLAVTKQRFEGGYVSGLDVANAESQVAGTMARIPVLEASIYASQYALGVLLGQEPVALLEELGQPEGAGAIPVPPGEVPVGLPSELLRRRPDIRAAEERVHAATANVGVAVADLYPKFSITGSLGVQSGNVQGLGSIANRYWSVGPGVSWPLLDGGKIRANIRFQQALASESGIAYQRTVLVALQDAETSLTNFEKEQQRRAALEQAVVAARRATELSRLLYTEGKTDFLNVLTAQGQQFASEDALVQSERAVSGNLVSVYKALGAGWEEKDGELNR